MTLKGFQFAAIEAAIKKPGRLDLALIYSEVPATVAAAYTTNKVKAAPVILSQQRTEGGTAQALVVNSGNANACTGQAGMDDARRITRLVAEGLGIPDEAVLPSSTGVIGQRLPVERIVSAIPGLVERVATGTLGDVAQAIMTTDTFPKMEVRQGSAGGTGYTIAGIAKGAGMIMPNMATMLAFIVTDADVDPAFLRHSFLQQVESSFNAITVDGDTSTNDTALIFANGQAGNPRIMEGSPEAEGFATLLGDLLGSLARQIVRDGEGATKFVQVIVTGARSDGDAKRAAMAVANSQLVKTAFFGQDANWGRIFAAVGYSGVEVDQERLSLRFNDVLMATQGIFAGGDAEARGSAVLKEKEFTVTIDLGLGTGNAKVFTSDLSYDYVKINADYRT
ncbi:MAG TPA: bifunctional glutamate N-acetyltransferase/amino-acid acetyltransferase ArgJ [Geobacterales bacterium]|nr:bifunctional glutamate N-acetyltransferase/amino-acid acetyltransferase ArgJ [Geobacterales bacterium]